MVGNGRERVWSPLRSRFPRSRVSKVAWLGFTVTNAHPPGLEWGASASSCFNAERGGLPVVDGASNYSWCGPTCADDRLQC